MPTAALRPCSVPRCSTLVSAGKCSAHDVSSAALGWSQDTTRVRGRQLQRNRARLFSDEPLCRTCRAGGRVTVATIRDHIVPLAEGGTDADDNVQPLCQDCSDIKTRAEAARGRARAR